MSVPDPAEVARLVELVSAAYAEAMREHGLLPGTATVIQSSAEAKLADVLGGTFPVYPPDPPARIDRLA